MPRELEHAIRRAVVSWLCDDLHLTQSDVKEIDAVNGQWGVDIATGVIPTLWLPIRVTFEDDRLPITRLFAFVVTT